MLIKRKETFIGCLGFTEGDHKLKHGTSIGSIDVP